MQEPKFRRMLRRYYRDVFPPGQKPFPVAMSVFLGAFIGVLPTLGIAIPLTWIATAVFRVPKAPGIVASFIATPPTLFFFFYPLGYFAVGLPLLHPPPIHFDFLKTFGELTLTNIDDVGAMLWNSAKAHVLAFFAGMSVVATISASICAVPVYVIMRKKQHEPASEVGDPELSGSVTTRGPVAVSTEDETGRVS